MTQLVAEAGRTRLSTRRQRRRIRFAVLLALLGGIAAVAVGAAAAAWLNGAWQWPTLETRSFRDGGGGLFGLGADQGQSPGALRRPG